MNDKTESNLDKFTKAIRITLEELDFIDLEEFKKRRLERTEKRLLSWDSYERMKLLKHILKNLSQDELVFYYGILKCLKNTEQ